MRFKRNIKRTLTRKIDFEVNESVINTIQSFRQNNGNEMSGILLGSEISSSKIRINKCSPPFVVESTSHSVVRDALSSNEYINEEFESSNHTKVYIGEWHTHPENIPSASYIDRQSIRQIFAESRLVLKIIVMAIVGRSQIKWYYFDGNNIFSFIPQII